MMKYGCIHVHVATPKSSKILLLVLPDTPQCSPANRGCTCSHNVYCTKPIKLHRLLLLDSGLCV